MRTDLEIVKKRSQQSAGQTPEPEVPGFVDEVVLPPSLGAPQL